MAYAALGARDSVSADPVASTEDAAGISAPVLTTEGLVVGKVATTEEGVAVSRMVANDEGAVATSQETAERSKVAGIPVATPDDEGKAGGRAEWVGTRRKGSTRIADSLSVAQGWYAASGAGAPTPQLR